MQKPKFDWRRLIARHLVGFFSLFLTQFLFSRFNPEIATMLQEFAFEIVAMLVISFTGIDVENYLYVKKQYSQQQNSDDFNPEP
jgi:hypothetical protein